MLQVLRPAPSDPSGRLSHAGAPRRKTCRNTGRVRRTRLERDVLAALGTRLMDPGLAEAFAQEWNRLAAANTAAGANKRGQLAQIERQIEHLVDAVADGGGGIFLAWVYSREFSGDDAPHPQRVGLRPRRGLRGRPRGTPRELRLMSLALNSSTASSKTDRNREPAEKPSWPPSSPAWSRPVIVLDNQLLVKTMNPAARRAVPHRQTAGGNSLIALCRNSALDEFARRAEGRL